MIVSPTITPIGLDSLRLTWTGTAGKTVRVFVNGELIDGPTIYPSDEKEVVIGVPNPAAIAVHENDADESVPAASLALHRKPLVWWLSVDGAAHYRVYFGDRLVGTVQHEPSRLHHELQIPEDIRVDGAVWTSLRVEAVSPAGAETVTAAKDSFAPGVPLAPSDVTVTGGAGVFDVTVVTA